MTLAPVSWVLLRILAIVLVVAVAGGVRLRALDELPVDYDEDGSPRAGQGAVLMRSGDWAGCMQTNDRPDHPPLNRIAFGVALLPQPEVAVVLLLQQVLLERLTLGTLRE
ncbi:MAG: hypothetical protein JXB85_00430 [Anaerolineales bacterium]|nr:hypothetical protein [Anaerolineales bacterium]